MRSVTVMTTIYNPTNLDVLYNSTTGDDHIVIVTDRKTPDLKMPIRNNVHILDIKSQIKLCKNPIGVPFDCIQRRNFGYIYAIKHLDPEYILTIDDDNFPEETWLDDHINNLGVVKDRVFESKVNVLNELLKICCENHENCLNVVHRGVSFAQAEEFNNGSYEYKTNTEVNVGVNAGMWDGDPDINAYDRILHKNIGSKANRCSLVINPNKWVHPFNSQNTSFVKKLFPTIFLIPMFPKFYGYKFGRFDDIWQSYICQKIMAHYNLHVRFGTPVVRQERNNHNVITDLNEEYPGMIFTSKFISALDSIKLLCNDPLENMYEIADAFLLSNEEILKYVGNKMLWWLTEIK